MRTEPPALERGGLVPPDEERAVARAWHAAAEDLGIAVVAPFTLAGDGVEYPVAALVRAFGTAAGTIICSQERAEALRALAEASGYRCAGLCADDYKEYQRDLFVWLLDDFEWCGTPAERPPWHTGPERRAS